MISDQDTPRGSAEPSEPPAPQRVPTIRAEELLHGARELRIVHGSETYRLLLTRNNKLILQK